MVKHKTNPRRGKALKKACIPGSIDEKTVLNICSTQSIIFEDLIPTDKYIELSLKVISYYNHMVKHRGYREATKRFKKVRVYALKHALGMNPEPVDCLSLGRDGFPRDIMCLKDFFYSRDPKKLRMVNTILSLPRISQVKNPLTLSCVKSITAGINKNEDYHQVLKQFDDFCELYFKQLKYKKQNPEEIKPKFRNVSGKGPNSSILKADALTCAPFDAIAISRDSEVKKSLRTILVDHYKCNSIWDYIMKLSSIAEQLLNKLKIPTCDLKTGKIISMPAPENKARIVAMVDYFSQMVLYPVREFLDDFEKHHLKNSFVRDQDKGRSLVKTWTSATYPVSLDASDFTDRFPLDVQQIVLKHMTNDRFAYTVCQLMSNRGFSLGSTGKTVWYKTGQPMGMQASFQLANATHCLIAMWSSRCAKIPLDQVHRQSAVVGDDIVFKDESSSKNYLRIMKALGLEFSEFKGFDSIKPSEFISEVKISEFCKRTYLHGELISGFTPSPFLNFKRDYKHVLSVRNLISQYIEVPVLVKMISKTVANRFQEKCYDLLALAPLFDTGYKRPSTTILKHCSQTVQEWFDSLIHLSEFQIEYQVNSLVLQCMDDTFEEEKRKVSTTVERLEKDAEQSMRSYSDVSERSKAQKLGLGLLKSTEFCEHEFPEEALELKRPDLPEEKQTLGRALYDVTMSIFGRGLTFIGYEPFLKDSTLIQTPLAIVIAEYKKGNFSPNAYYYKACDEDTRFELLNSHNEVESIKHDYTQSLYTGDSTAYNLFVNRLDSRQQNECDRVLFKCTNSLIEKISSLEMQPASFSQDCYQLERLGKVTVKP